MTPDAADRPVIVLTTLGADADVEQFARTLVEERLAACVSVLPVMTSTYRWKDAITTDREHQLVVKTTAGRLPALEERLRTLHPYEVPELLMVEPAGGGQAYLDWLRDNTRPQGS